MAKTISISDEAHKMIIETQSQIKKEIGMTLLVSDIADKSIRFGLSIMKKDIIEKFIKME